MTLEKIAISFKQYEELEAEKLMVDVLRRNLMSAQAERDSWVAKHKECAQLLGEAMQDRADMAVERDECMRQSDLQMNSAIKFCQERNAARIERDAYAKAADAMAAAHKVERDALTNAARFALDALEYHTAQTRSIERTQIAIEILKAVL